MVDIDAANADAWLLELERKTLVRLTPSRSNNHPIWTRDGQRIADSSSAGDGRKPYWFGIFSVSVDPGKAFLFPRRTNPCPPIT